MHVIAAKAVAFHEAMQPAFRQYAAAIVANAKALAAGLLDKGLAAGQRRDGQPPAAGGPAQPQRRT